MSLTTSLSTALGALEASQGAIAITNNNIANVDTPGYTREIADLQETNPPGLTTASIGTGVELAGYTSVRDELLQSQILQQTQQQSSASAQLTTLQQVEQVFTTSTNDIGTEMSSLFSSLSELSTDPTDTSSRQAVLTAGQNLATAFNTASNTLSSQQAGLDTQTSQDVSQINQLTSQIAALNAQVAGLQKQDPGENGGTAEDQENQLIQQLSQTVGVQITQTEAGITLTTGNGTPLVVGGQSYNLETSTASDGSLEVLDSNGDNITSAVQGGDLGGTLQTRNQTLPSLSSQLDTLASQFATAMNAAQSLGYDANGNAGGAFFSIPSTTAGAAAGIKVALTNTSQIAASSDGSSGSDGNLANFASVQTNALPGGDTPSNTYANLVYQVGSLSANATAEQTATSASLEQLNSQLSSVSGVSIDEETTNLMQYQQTYQAAAQVVSVLEGLFSTTINMMTPAAD